MSIMKAHKFVIFSDVQGNFPQLCRLLQKEPLGEGTLHVGLGDIVQYGNTGYDALCVRQFAMGSVVGVRGNHDDTTLLGWGQGLGTSLTEEDILILKALPITLNLETNIAASHKGPTNQEYVRTLDHAKKEFNAMGSHWIYFFGHTHDRVIFEQRPSGTILKHFPDEHFALYTQSRYLINPGAIGLYGAEERRSYATFDSKKRKVIFHDL